VFGMLTATNHVQRHPSVGLAPEVSANILSQNPHQLHHLLA
jgi:hypothetical protein